MLKTEDFLRGMPKICVPVMGATLNELAHSATSAMKCAPDIVEWRMDWMENLKEDHVVTALQLLHEQLGATPLLATFRSKKEGGVRTLSPDDYEALHRQAILSGVVSLVDIELYSCDTEDDSAEMMLRLTQFAREHGVISVGSSHDFEKTPAEDVLIARMERMALLGCDIAKIAVMPRCSKDVLTLLSATEEMKRRQPELPIITMSMGQLGLVSRLCGEVFGSALTFGSAGRASAPGQADAHILREILQLLHGEA